MSLYHPGFRLSTMVNKTTTNIKIAPGLLQTVQKQQFYRLLKSKYHRYCLHTRGAVLRETVFTIGHVPTIMSKSQVQEIYIQTVQSSYSWVSKDSAFRFFQFQFTNRKHKPTFDEFE